MLRLTPHLRRLLHRTTTSPSPSLPPISTYLRHLTTQPQPQPQPQDENDQIALSLSSHLLKETRPPTATDTAPAPAPAPLSLSQSLDLSFSHVSLTPPLILKTLKLSPTANRSVLHFLSWVSSKPIEGGPNAGLTDEVLSYFVDHFGRRKDFKAMHNILVDQKGVIGFRTFACYVDRLVKAGRVTRAVAFFENLEQEYGVVRDKEMYKHVVKSLCVNGYGNRAEKMVKGLANVFFPDDHVCELLIKGWCVDRKLEEAKRLAREMYRGGFELGTGAYNAILECVCTLCRFKEPIRLVPEAESLLLDMDTAGVPRNTETFNILISNLCKIRKTEESMNLFFRMGEWGCHPDARTFTMLIRSLYLAARVGEGDEMIDRMKSAGYGDALGEKEYSRFITTLCGVERIDHALRVFKMMQKDGCKPGVETYELLVKKFHAHNQKPMAINLFNQAVHRGVKIEPKDYEVDPRFIKKRKVKKVKKRLTLPEKTVLKRKKLKKIRLSYVKKSKKQMRRAL